MVTSEFRDFVLREKEEVSSYFRSSFLLSTTVYLKHSPLTDSIVMSLDRGKPEWLIERSDHRRLEEAQRLRLQWQAISASITCCRSIPRIRSARRSNMLEPWAPYLESGRALIPCLP